MKINKLKSAVVWVILCLCSIISIHLYAQPCVYANTGYYCISEGSVGLIGPANTTFVNLGNAVTVSVTPDITDDTNETVTYYNNTSNDNTPGCPPDISIGGTPPGYGVTWTASEGSWSTNGTGLTANVTPPSCGGGSVSFVCNYTNQYPCTNTGSSGTGCKFTVVSLNITDGSGNLISSANSNDTVIVGEQVGLTAQTCGGTFSNYQWTVDGTTESGFFVSPGPTNPGYYGDGWTNGYPVALTDTTNSGVSFFWVDEGTKSVVCSAICGGITANASASLNVLKPTSAVFSKTANVALGNNINNSYYGLCFGTNGGPPGIVFSKDLVMPSGYYNNGNTNYNIEWIQLLTTWNVSQTTVDGITHNRNTSGVVLDTTYPYDVSNPTDDSPSVGTDGALAVSDNQISEMWLMFRPEGGQWVPLRIVEWNWLGSATNSASGWVLTDSSHSNNPPDSDAGTTYPIWTDNALDTNAFYWKPPF